METPPVHVLLEIQGGEVVEANAEISTPTVTESSAGDDSDEGSPAPAPESAPPPSPPPGAPIKVRTAGGREVIVLEKTQQGWFSVELDGNANDNGRAPAPKVIVDPEAPMLMAHHGRKKRRRGEGRFSKKEDSEADLLELIGALEGAVSPPSAGELQLRRELKQLRRENKRLKTLNRPGWIGAYSPEARKRRIARFHGKRARRVWTKPPPRHRRAAPAAARSPNDS